jgi:hypothetical protein
MYCTIGLVHAQACLVGTRITTRPRPVQATQATHRPVTPPALRAHKEGHASALTCDPGMRDQVITKGPCHMARNDSRCDDDLISTSFTAVQSVETEFALWRLVAAPKAIRQYNHGRSVGDTTVWAGGTRHTRPSYGSTRRGSNLTDRAHHTCTQVQLHLDCATAFK